MLRATLNRILKGTHDPAWALKIHYHYLKTRRLPFAKLGRDAVIVNPIQITHPECIELGDDVFIWDHARLNVLTEYGQNTYQPRLVLHRGVNLGQNAHIVCADRIELHEGVTFGPFVTLADAYHDYADMDTPIMQQKMVASPIVIGEHTLVNAHCFIKGGVTIGRHCFIGAMSVVTQDLPDYSVAVGNPAKVIRVRS